MVAVTVIVPVVMVVLVAVAEVTLEGQKDQRLTQTRRMKFIRGMTEGPILPIILVAVAVVLVRQGRMVKHLILAAQVGLV